MSESTTSQKLPKDAAAEAGMVNVQVDGTWHQFPKGMRLIDALESIGVEVPHYCYHPKLSSPGNCRMCMVEQGMPPRPLPGTEPQYDVDGYLPIQWMPRPIIACANTVGENMGVRTKSLLVNETRKGVMEFLLANHPLDCPICDQAGECRLQEFSVGFGKGTSRFEEQKVKKPKNVDIGPRIRLDDERCIMCSRCIRFMNEVAEDPVLGFTERGGFTTLAVHPNRQLDHNYGLNTVDICPVGALTATDFRFQMRVWFLKETQSIDVNCGTGCNTTIWTRNNQIYRVTPRENNAVNSAWMPDSHRLNFHYLSSEARLTAPMIKSASGHRAVGWNAAIAAAAAGLKKFSPAQAAIVFSARMINEELWLARLLGEALGITTGTMVPRVGENDGYLIAADRNPNTEGVKTVMESANPAADLAVIRDGVRNGSIKCLVVLHENLLKEAGFSVVELAKLDFLVCLHILANPTAAAADVILPGSGFAEKSGTMINVTGRLQQLHAAITPPGDARDDVRILADLASACGAISAPDTASRAFEAVTAAIPALHGQTLEKIGSGGIQLYETGVTIPLLDRERARIQRGEITG